jgi:hypothetical protein
MWAAPSALYRRWLTPLKTALEGLAAGIPLTDRRATFGPLVGSGHIEAEPVHRWYAYKEAFSPRLPHEALALLKSDEDAVVADVFAGVATTALALQAQLSVRRVIGVEYSPFAHFVGRTKLVWHRLSPRRVERAIKRHSRFDVDRNLAVPTLAAFSNEDIFPDIVASQLVSARESIRSDAGLDEDERSFLLLGLAAVVEDASGAMKDGRALRILRGRKRRRKALMPQSGAVSGRDVRSLLTNHWLAMLEDLRELEDLGRTVRDGRTVHLRGDARRLGDVESEDGDPALADGSVSVSLFSPPYLNCIDYTEVYKLELWLLGFVTSQEGFRNVRLGTLRSHPSIEFPAQSLLSTVDAPVARLVEQAAEFMEYHLPRPGIGRMTRNYFEDMYRVFCEQARILRSGGHSVCIVGNSTFARRETVDGRRSESWRLPILTDVVLARLAEAAGLEPVGIWDARELRPRNVAGGSARESLVVLRKPPMS